MNNDNPSPPPLRLRDRRAACSAQMAPVTTYLAVLFSMDRLAPDLLDFTEVLDSCKVQDSSH